MKACSGLYSMFIRVDNIAENSGDQKSKKY